jgi:hypothetical protein
MKGTKGYVFVILILIVMLSEVAFGVSAANKAFGGFLTGVASTDAFVGTAPDAPGW